MAKAFGEILTIGENYLGTGFLLVLFVVAFVYLLVAEKDPLKRALLVYTPAVFAVLFLLPPFYMVYTKIESDTYYRILWLLPMSVVIAYAGLKLFKKHDRVGLIIMAALIIACGSYTYSNVNISPALNRYHIPQAAINVCDFLKTDAGEGRFKAAIPGELAQTVRQYCVDLEMPFGREMLVSKWDYYNEVYEEMEKPEVITAKKLIAATRNNKCHYIVLSSLRQIDQPLEQISGVTLLGNIDGFYIYADEKVPVRE